LLLPRRSVGNINARIDSLEERISMMEKLKELEIRIARLEKRKINNNLIF
jgi:uncharacterized coiled-coil protein SlyX